MKRTLLFLLALSSSLVPVACDAQGTSARPGDTSGTPAVAACTIETERVPLPGAIRESSGVARAGDGSLWTHNDGAEALLYRVSEGGLIEQVVAIAGVRALDLEDIDAAPCPGGSGDCLFVADTGDNDGDRAEVAILVIPVPAAGVERAAATRVAFRYPGGPRDAEALAVLPEGDALIVTKGRDEPIELYRLRLATAAEAPGVPERLAELASRPERNADRVTGAGASEDGAWLALRTSDALGVYRTDALLAGAARPAFEFDLGPLGESQGEGVDIASDGRVWLTSEGGATPLLARIRCSLPE